MESSESRIRKQKIEIEIQRVVVCCCKENHRVARLFRLKLQTPIILSLINFLRSSLISKDYYWYSLLIRRVDLLRRMHLMSTIGQKDGRVVTSHLL